MIILLHSSKTMRSSPVATKKTTTPLFIDEASGLGAYLKSLNIKDLQQVMKISPALAEKTMATVKAWSVSSSNQTQAIDSFLGDIYSGFQASTLSDADRDYAQDHLRILSGLYGILRPLDGISPYRLEMAYKLPSDKYSNLYKFWGNSLALSLSNTQVAEKVIINVSSVEYSKALLPYVPDFQIITPRFMTIDAKTNQPKFVVVHAKIARGAFARWLIKDRISSQDKIKNFTDLNYQYSKSLSTPLEPVFIASEFGGLGLSVRLK